MIMETKKAKIKRTGNIIIVYLLKRGTWCDYSDCKTEYSENELEFLN